MIDDSDDTTIDTDEGVLSSKLVFNNDAQLINYLDALLASAPVVDPDSGEVHYARLAVGTDWKTGSTTVNTDVDTAIFIKSELSIMEVNGLKNENEGLKFKTELAEIDTQVLRGENKILKDEIASLKMQLSDLQSRLDATLIQNSDLTSRIVEYHNKLEELTTEITNNHTEQQEDSPLIIEQLPELDPEPGPEPEPENLMLNEQVDSVSNRLIEPVVEPVIEPVVELQAHQSVAVPEVTYEDPPAPVTSGQKRHIDEKVFIAIDPVATNVSQPFVAGSTPHKKAAPEVVILSGNNEVFSTSVQSSAPVSTIIKQNSVEQIHRHKEPTQTAKSPVFTPAPLDSPAFEVEQKPVITHPQQITDAEIVETIDKPVSNNDSLLHDECDDIDMETAPAPKVVVRKNVKNYEDLQSEADPAKVPLTGHTIVL